ncbi:hypothetical protein [Ancylobacter mangrovi]|nr:hypothetical protein [Ancylobacter mangrovi]MCS0501833.1 hypothetical protein [Ancylobacter mangrovi]
MKPDQRNAAAGRLAGCLSLLGVALILGGCAAIGDKSSDAPAETLAQAIGAAPKQDPNNPNPAMTGAPQDLPYPNFGAPKQIGDRPVMTPEETQKVQSDLENLAKDREQKMLQDIEQSQ